MLKAKSLILRNNTEYRAGDELPEMDAREAQQLIDAGAAERVDETPASEPKKTASKPQAPQSETPNARWNRAKLAEYARANGIEFAEEATKAEILEAIESSATGSDTNEDEGSDEGSEDKPQE